MHVTKFNMHKLQCYLVDIQLSTKLWQFVCKATREKENIRGEIVASFSLEQAKAS